VLAHESVEANCKLQYHKSTEKQQTVKTFRKPLASSKLPENAT